MRIGLLNIGHLVADAEHVGVLFGVGQQQTVQLALQFQELCSYRLSRVCTAVTEDSPESCEVMAFSRERCSSSAMRVCSTCVRSELMRVLTSVTLPGWASAFRAR